MDTSKIYKQKIEARLALAHADFKLNDFKALLESFPENETTHFAQEIEALEKNLGVAKFKLRELNEAGDSAWEQFKGGAEHIWNELRASVKNASVKCKELQH